MLKVIDVVGARAEFIKIATPISAMVSHPHEVHPPLVQMGQRRDGRVTCTDSSDLQDGTTVRHSSLVSVQ